MVSRIFMRFQYFKKVILLSRQPLNFDYIKIKFLFSHLFKKINFKYLNNQINVSSNNRKTGLISLAACGVFSWDDTRISNDDIKNEINDILKQFDKKTEINSNRIDFESSRNIQDNEWEKIYDKKDLIIWRRKIGFDDESNLDIFEHKVLGRFNDISSLEYYRVQIDLDYRHEWDFLIKILKKLEIDSKTGTELVRWISKFPYPLKDREYMFMRRNCIEPDEKLMIIINRGLPELEGLPYSDRTVKVTQYKSNMIIIPYTDFNEHGFYYIIQYYDVNKAKIPKLAYKWIASSGLPDYMDKLHKATLKLREKSVQNEKLSIENFQIFRINEPAANIENNSVDIKDVNEEFEFVEADFSNEMDEIEEKISTIDQDLFNSLPPFLQEIAKKFNEDYFDKYEPHPIFFNY